MIRYVRCACLVLVVAASANAAALTPAKSPNDDRSYLSYVLHNGLRVLLVSDPDTVKAAASLDVDVGSGADPQSRQGLAHFLEHMLFLGTEKYPEPGEYQDFISMHGGGHNAYTSFRNTNYFFDIDAAQLEGGLDRFSQFFVAPLFNADYVQREINAVESEYRSKLKEDSRRSLDVFKEVINPQHPFSKLAVGNIQTLLAGATSDADMHKDSEAFRKLRAALLSFYEQHYSANKMALVVLGSEPINTLKKWVDGRFSSIPGKSGKQQVTPVPLFSDGALPAIVSLIPEKESRSLSLTFPIPAIDKHYKSKPSQYLGNIVGHEGKGSLLSLLKARGWAESLSAGAGLEHSGGATFNVTIGLTESGLENQNAIVEALFSLLQKIRDDGLERWRYKEQKGLLETAFRFQEEGPVMSYTSRLASNLQRYPAKAVLRGDYLLTRYKPRLIENILDHLRPENALITIMAPAQPTTKVSRWYNTSYATRAIPKETLQEWQQPGSFEGLGLPTPNPFIATDFSMRGGSDADKPEQIDSSENSELWWAKNTRFGTPKSQASFLIESKAVSSDVRAAAMSQLLADVLSDSLNEYSYPAYLAGISFQVRRQMQGLVVSVGGFSDKQPLLLERIAKALDLQNIDEQRLQNIHAELLRRWSNANKRVPYQQLFGALNEKLVANVWTPDQLASALPGVSVAELKEYAAGYLDSSRLRGLITGNVSREQALEYASALSAKLSCRNTSCAALPRQVSKTPADQWLGLDMEIDHPDSALLIYRQLPDQSAQNRALSAMAGQVLQAPYFQQLRTEQQLGYVVFATPLPLLDVPGNAFIVQSPGHSVAHILQSTSDFVVAQLAALETQEARSNYEQQKQALLGQLDEPPKNLTELAGRYWSELSLGYASFNRRASLREAVSAQKYSSWKQYMQEELQGGVLVYSSGARETGELTLAPKLRLLESTTLEAMTAFTVGASEAELKPRQE
ncbi:MAG: insulinase family protein [Pseudomonadales bacterium]